MRPIRSFYYLVVPGQPTMQYYLSLFEGIPVFDETRPFFYYLFRPTIIIPRLKNVVINPYKLALLLTGLGELPR